MARRPTRGARGGRTAAPARQPRAKSRKPAPSTELEVVEETGGLGIDSSIVIATSAILFLGILFVDALLGKFDEGMFL